MLLNHTLNKRKHRILVFKKKHYKFSSACCSCLIRVVCWYWSLPQQLPWRQADGGPEYPERDEHGHRVGQDLSVMSAKWRLDSPHPGVTAGKRACRHAELQACPTLMLSLSSHVKWSSRTPHSASDRLIKTRPGSEDEDCQSSVKSFEEQLRSSSTNKRAKQEQLERKEKGLWERLRMSVKEKVICVMERETREKREIFTA